MVAAAVLLQVAHKSIAIRWNAQYFIFENETGSLLNKYNANALMQAKGASQSNVHRAPERVSERSAQFSLRFAFNVEIVFVFDSNYLIINILCIAFEIDTLFHQFHLKLFFSATSPGMKNKKRKEMKKRHIKSKRQCTQSTSHHTHSFQHLNG